MKKIPFYLLLFLHFTLFAQTEEEWLEKGLEDIPIIQLLDSGSSREMLTEQNIKNLLMPPRKQVSQHSSMYYALASALEFYVNLEGNYKLNLSPEFIKLSLPFEKQNLKSALELLKEEGTVSAAFLPYDSKKMNSTIYQADRYKIKNYLTLFKPEFRARHKDFAIKKALIRGNPVIATLSINQHFQKLSSEDRIWDPEEGNTDTAGLQTVLVVGFDEDKDAYEIMNFQGFAWGYRGCIWVDYEDFADYVQEGFVLAPLHLDSAIK